jgi:hypothetical protein
MWRTATRLDNTELRFLPAGLKGKKLKILLPVLGTADFASRDPLLFFAGPDSEK